MEELVDQHKGVIQNFMMFHQKLGRYVQCFTCKKIPEIPVTGPCGHTICKKCLNKDECSCGEKFYSLVSTDVCVQRFVDTYQDIRDVFTINRQKEWDLSPLSIYGEKEADAKKEVHKGIMRAVYRRRNRSRPVRPRPFLRDRDMSTRRGFQLKRDYRPRSTPTLQSYFRRMAYKMEDYMTCFDENIECVICSSPIMEPVVTGCGHIYCRCCLEESKEYVDRCSFCRGDLADMSVAVVKRNEIVTVLIRALRFTQKNVKVEEHETNMPILLYQTVFPTIATYMTINNPEYRVIIRKLLKSGQNRFGVVDSDNNDTMYRYGTILEICDVVTLSDKSIMVTALAVARFRMNNLLKRQGHYMGYVDFHYDDESLMPYNLIMDLMAAVHRMCLHWYGILPEESQAILVDSFGPMPEEDRFSLWHPNGPRWIWWMLDMLPLPNKNKKRCLMSNDIGARLILLRTVIQILLKHLGCKRNFGLDPEPYRKVQYYYMRSFLSDLFVIDS